MDDLYKDLNEVGNNKEKKEKIKFKINSNLFNIIMDYNSIYNYIKEFKILKLLILNPETARLLTDIKKMNINYSKLELLEEEEKLRNKLFSSLVKKYALSEGYI